MSPAPRAARVILALAALPAAAAGAQDSVAPRPLFASHEVIPLTLELPLRSLRADRGQDSPERPAVAVFTGTSRS